MDLVGAIPRLATGSLGGYRAPLVVATMVIVGCGPSYPPVSGRVTIAGRPAAGVQVLFTPLSTGSSIPPGPYAQATTDAEGRYSLVTRRGIPGATPGRNLVELKATADANGRLIVTTEPGLFIRDSDQAPDGGSNRPYTDPGAISRGLGLHSRSNYVGAMGVNGHWGMSELDYFLKALNWPLNPHKLKDWGIMGINSQTRFAHIRDGTSNTILIGERSTAANTLSWLPAHERVPRGGIWSGWFDGCEAGGHGTRMSTLGCVSRRSGAPEFTVNGSWGSIGVASSYHPSGANVAMADASVHFISEDIAFPTFCDLNAMADGASVALP